MATTPQTPGRRERRKQETRRRLLDAARGLIAAGGADAIRIGDVTDHADVGFGTFYSYFETKEALIAALISDTLEHTAKVIGTRALESEDPAEAAAISYRRYLAYASEQPELAGVLVGLPDAERLFEATLAPQARQALERGVQSGRFDIDDIELALTSVAASSLAAMRANLAGRLAPGAAEHGAVMMLRGLGVPDAEAREIVARPLPRIDIGE